MDWYYASDGQQQGPVSRERLMELFRSGEVKGSDLVWNESMSDWRTFSSVPELSGGAAASPVAGQAGSGRSPAGAAPLELSAPLPPEAGPARPSAALPGGQVPNYLWQSIACLLCCCVPFGIVALVFSAKVEPALRSGDLAAAVDASNKARMWCWIAFGTGIVVQGLYLTFVIVADSM